MLYPIVISNLRKMSTSQHYSSLDFIYLNIFHNESPYCSLKEIISKADHCLHVINMTTQLQTALSTLMNLEML